MIVLILQEVIVKQEDFLMAESLIPHRRRMMLIERIKKPDESGLQGNRWRPWEND